MANANAALRKKAAAVIAAMRMTSGMTIGPVSDVERPPVQGVRLEVQHRQPDPHRRQDLHHGQPPVGEHELHALEQHHEGAHRECEGCQPATRAAHAQDRCLDHRLVAVADGLDQFAQAAHHGDTERVGDAGGVSSPYRSSRAVARARGARPSR